MKVPVIPVYAPNHSFVRFCFDDGSYINWEPIKGQSLPDAYYMSTLRIPGESIRDGVYMKSLTRQEFIGVEYNNIGAHLMTQRSYEEAVPYFSAAIKLYRGSHPPITTGAPPVHARAPHGALVDVLKANELDPEAGDAEHPG